MRSDYMYQSTAERIERNVLVTEADCWEWQARTDRDGYGLLWIGPKPTRKLRFAHRISYQVHIGPIPDGLQIDHLCRNRACCNPKHLEPVTTQENTRRGAEARAGWCRNGHKRDAGNTYLTPTGHSACRECHREASRRYRERLTR